MLTALSIRDFVLIEALDLEPGRGLTVLTGETGAGKSILLDALGAACGARSETGLVRQGADRASVTAGFDLPPCHPARALLAANEIDGNGPLLLRRVVGADGKSRAFINDQPVSVGLLRQLGEQLVEVHGQFDTHGLLDPATHRALLDRAAELDPEPARTTFASWQAAKEEERAAREAEARARAEEDELRDAVEELTRLAPQPGEEDELTTRRNLLQHSARIAEALATAREALAGEQGAETALATAGRALGKVAEQLGPRGHEALQHLDAARDAVAEASARLDSLADDSGENGLTLEQVEDRLYALRAAARRHRIDLSELPNLTAALRERLALLDSGGRRLSQLADATAAARAAYQLAARELSARRTKAARKLEKAVAAELPPLRLERAEFFIELSERDEAQWGPDGWDSVRFLVRTNPGSPPGLLDRMASGGELARFMLALKVVLADSTEATTLIFDEVDQGVGGAVATAVGERLARLGRQAQVLVVTHSPQVAAAGKNHWRVEKEVGRKAAHTRLSVLDAAARQEEIARMLAGSTITEAARKAARELLAGELLP